MKKIVILSVLAFVGVAANAQYYYQDAANAEMLRHTERHEACRKEVVLPQVNGYTVYKADLHTHTVFSDGQVLPKFRVAEAWMDGLDIMAVTEHVEHRPVETTMVDYLESYTSDKVDGAINNKIQRKPATEEGIMVDLNYSIRESQAEAAKYGLTIIPGAEITRDGKTIGHFNALFTTDNNLIYDPDPVQAVRNAKAQNALVMHNHPGWRRQNLEMTATERAVYDAGMVDGIEVMNGAEFYPGIVDRVQEIGAFIAANTDIHRSTRVDYGRSDVDRPMTLILATENTLPAIREALEADRTIAYAFNTLCGEEQLLKDFFVAGVIVRRIPGQENSSNPTLMLTNNTSLSYVIRFDGANPQRFDPFSTISVKPGKGSDVLKFTVVNMFCSKDRHPVIELAF